MRIYVFKLSNEPLGKFEVATVDEISSGLLKFGKTKPLSAYDYAEGGKEIWTMVPGEDGLVPVQGRHRPGGDFQIDFGQFDTSIEKIKPSRHFKNGYFTAKATISRGLALQRFGTYLGLVICCAGYFFRGFGLFGFVLGSLGGTVLYALGSLLSAQGQIMKAAIDNAVSTSPFLTNEEKASVMSLKV